ncbi:simple sugar transport system permease protein [Aequitasia blattaphilus]|uniref:ABC transporter permease n=1 Tax=Aequitasia blattaphilus TaxID=2949332 RepID=A0ABT1EA67_9FIRM|nr:ABC transporter permease [Aequitasia blattaphilus]MCP1102693.1 ABC transporter permease [Aequitasia blattaphilus]MCR8615333.1 ABC transporter permease [Aequitasia blattaphilus]
MSRLSLKKLKKQTEFYVFLIIIALAVFIQIRSGLFFTNNNLVDLLRSMIVPSIYALCALLAFVSTGPDVSFPLIAALSSYLATDIATKMNYKGPVVFVFLIGMFFGMLMGALNGFIIVKYKFPSLIVTLGTSTIFSGILLGAFEAERMDLPESMARFGKQSLLTVVNAKSGLGSTLPMTFIILIILYVIAYLILNFTMVGRGVYALGGDEISAERAGFNVKAIRFGVFVVNGGIAAIGGLCYSIMSMRYLPTEFAGGEMIVIAAVILGGTRMTGGVGTLKGCLLGTLLLTMVSNSLILIGVAVSWQKVFIGAIIIIGTAISALQSRSGAIIKKKIKKEAA